MQQGFIYGLNNISSADIPKIQVNRIGRYGELIDFGGGDVSVHKIAERREVRRTQDSTYKPKKERILARFGESEYPTV